MQFFFSRTALALALCCTLGQPTLAQTTSPAAQPTAHAHEAPVEISNAWARATVPGQGGTAAFMTLQAASALKLVGASSPVAGVAQVHEMKLENNTMHMRAMTALDLPAHQNVTLTPGGEHLMLMDLKQPLTAGSEITLTLQFTDASGARLERTLQVPVRTTAPDGAPAQTMHHKH